MRITGGSARGIPLRSARNSDVRPATDQLRQAVFNSLGPDRVAGVSVLDLFAGTGAYGLEALSRGAARAVFVEQDRAADPVLAANLAAVARSAGFPPSTGRIVIRDVLRWAPPPGETYGLILIDPPYELAARAGDELLARTAAWLAPGGRIVFEVPGNQDLAPPQGMTLLRRLGGEKPRQPGVRIFGWTVDIEAAAAPA